MKSNPPSLRLIFPYLNRGVNFSRKYLADPEIVKALEPWKVVVDEQANVKIAKSRVYLDNECWKKECNFGNLITDAMVDSVRSLSHSIDVNPMVFIFPK